MGCDIHLYAELRESGQWKTADRWSKDEYAEEGENRLRVGYDDRFYNGRNYNLFAILADVRNGRGFAGIKTGEGYNPISEPKGLPEDVSPEVRAESDAWGCDGHSHSWLTVAEIMAYDWTQVSCLQGWVSGIEFNNWNEYRRRYGLGPEAYCASVVGGPVKHIAIEEMERQVKALRDSIPKGFSNREAISEALSPIRNTYCLVEWTEPYFLSGKEFLSEAMPRLWRLGSPDDVRIVFWFDN